MLCMQKANRQTWSLSIQNDLNCFALSIVLYSVESTSLSAHNINMVNWWCYAMSVNSLAIYKVRGSYDTKTCIICETGKSE